MIKPPCATCGHLWSDHEAGDWEWCNDVWCLCNEYTGKPVKLHTNDLCVCGHTAGEHYAEGGSWQGCAYCTCPSWDAAPIQVSETSSPGKPPRDDTHAVRVIELRTGTVLVRPVSLLIAAPCGNCGHDWIKHRFDDEPLPVGWEKNSWKPHCSLWVRGSKQGACACAGFTPKYRLASHAG